MRFKRHQEPRIWNQPERDKNGEGRKRAENGGANKTRPTFSFYYQHFSLAD
jgi:hypothetical protein